MLIYLRHGDDRGDDVYRHDRRLNDRGKKKAPKAARKLIEKYGHPEAALVSPFLRAIETVECMRAAFTRPVDVHLEPRIAQHLSDKQMRDPRVSPATLAVVDIQEDDRAFKDRIASHAASARARAAAPSIVWCVTHQAVIEEVARHFSVKISGGLDFLDHVVMLG
ncbi:MAG TPA: phosphoglycerate mutase family protein [Gaiellaceae bacterium]|nr:phosphoglycerate mutase family protein [Gaiellaceae bacterium]